MRGTAEAMVEPLFIVDRETGRLFVVEGAAGLELAPRTRDLHRTADQRGQRDPGTEFIKPLRG